MALSDEEKNLSHENGGSNQQQQPSGPRPSFDGLSQQQHENSSNILGFTDTSAFHAMSSGAGSEYANSLKSKLSEMFQDMAVVQVLDNKVTNLAYSTIVVSVRKASVVAYYLVLLEATGRRPIQAKAYLEEIMLAVRNATIRPGSYTTSDAVDTILITEARRVLEAQYKDIQTFINVDGLVVPHTISEFTEDIVRSIAAASYNACVAEVAGRGENPEFKDLNINHARNAARNIQLKLDPYLVPHTVKDILGRPSRADFILSLDAIDGGNNNASINAVGGKTNVLKVAGYIDAIPRNTSIAVGQGVQVPGIRLHPNIVISSMSLAKPTLGHTLLAVATASTMVKPDLWVSTLANPINRMLHDQGVLNITTNLDAKPDGIGEPLKLYENKLKADDLYNIIRKMYSLTPLISMDVEVYGPQTSFTSVISLASTPASANQELEKGKSAAIKTIINTASWLTNGNFPTDFDPRQIFMSEGIVIPLGTWVDKEGALRDLRELDLSMVATLAKGDTDIMNKWVLSNIPMNNSGLDPFVTKLEIISDLLPAAEITGKAVRVMFNPTFITTLNQAATAAGLDTRYDQQIIFQEQSNLAAVNSFLGDNVQNIATDFARPYGGNTNTYRTQYATGGGFNPHR